MGEKTLLSLFKVIMATLRLYIYSRNARLNPFFSDKDDQESFIDDIRRTLTHDCEIERFVNSCGVVLLNTQKTRDALHVLQSKYDANHREIRKLTMFISANGLAENERFFVFDAGTAKWSDRRLAIDELRISSTSYVELAMYHNQHYHNYFEVERFFDVYGYGFDGIKVAVGEPDKSKRKCRFCGCTDPGKYKDVAHAIQDSLGNKLLVCYEECDACNHKLNAVEDHFLHLMDVRRCIFHIARKNSTKSPHVIGDNFALHPDENGDAVLYLKKEPIEALHINIDKPFGYRLHHKANVTNEGIYKALAKMVIDLMPSDRLCHFTNTIKWLRSEEIWSSDVLPSIIFGSSKEKLFYKQPALDVCFNKEEDGPYCTGILWIYDVVYLFVMPFVDVDRGKFKWDGSLVEHWKFLLDRFMIQSLNLQDGWDWHRAAPWIDMTIEFPNPRIILKDGNDDVFVEAQVKKDDEEAVSFPAFTSEGIIVNRVKVDFYCQYHGEAIPIEELHDLTFHFDIPIYEIEPRTNQIVVKTSIQVNDTTDKVAYFAESFKVVFSLKYFRRFVRLEYAKKGELNNLAIDIALRDYLFEQALKAAENKAKPKRENTSFEVCSLVKLLQYKERLLSLAYWKVRIKKRFFVFSDCIIHGVDYLPQ